MPGTAARRASEPYPGYSQGLPYEPKTEEDLFWKPSAAAKQAGRDDTNCGVGLHLVLAAAVRSPMLPPLPKRCRA
jgi:hypothetical protein